MIYGRHSITINLQLKVFRNTLEIYILLKIINNIKINHKHGVFPSSTYLHDMFVMFEGEKYKHSHMFMVYLFIYIPIQ